MADINYTVSQDLPENIDGFEQYSQEDKNLISSFQINSVFDPEKNYSELHILSLSDELLESDYLYNRHKQLGNAQSAGQDGASVLTIDPIADSKYYGYEGGGIKLLYHFLDDLYTDDITTREFFIQDMSPDRTEVILNSLNITQDEVTTYTSTIKSKLESQSYFAGFRLNFKSNDLVIATNIDTIDSGAEKVVTVKLYEPLPEIYDIKSTLTVVEIVSDSIAYEVDSEYVIQPEQLPTLRSANFNIEIADESVVPTAYLNYNELFSYPVSNANNELFSAINEKGIEINVDYTDLSSFIHFSSAEERLLNFKYKVDLLSSYFASISSSQAATTGLQGVSGSRTYYEGLITGVVSNFDHYERYLYYKSGSSSWPKSNTTKPYINKTSTAPEAITWFTTQRSQATYYDQTNYNSLINSIPAYLRDDANNDNYLTFIYMVGQHFDNLWLYSKAVTDKYDADNRINKGISKDLVGEALKNFGVKLYTSNKSTEDLFSTFTGQAYQSGSEKIKYYITGSLTGSNASIQPSSFDNYQKEIQKRIYHNLPLLLKSKGTERGLRALINCFGIPGDILDIKLYGGKNTSTLPFLGNSQYTTSSLNKIRLDNTGSLISGSTLSNYTSIIKRDNKYTDDIHTIEVGFSPTDNIDAYIISKSAATFSIDEYLGDPGNLYLDNYSGLYRKADTLLSGSLGTSSSYDLQDYVRLIKFFDNTVFKMVKDFIPARSIADVGVIIKPNILNISKAKSVSVSVTQPEYTASIDTAFFEGASAGAFSTKTTTQGHYDTSWVEEIQTPQGIHQSLQNYGTDKPLYTGELGGSSLTISNGELNKANPYKQIANTLTLTNIRQISKFPAGVCGVYSKNPVTITRNNNPYNIVNYFDIPGGDVVTYTIKSGSESASALSIPSASSYTFLKNYTTYTVTASKEAAPASIAGCTGSVLFNVEFCDLAKTSIVPASVEGGRQVDLTRWFTTGSNTSSSYSASYSNLAGTASILDPNNYYFATSSNYITASVLLRDNRIATCNNTAQVIVYPTMSVVEIGVQDWSQTNLDVATYSDGTIIPQVTDPTEWANLTTGAWCYYNNYNYGTYSKLYNWYAVVGIYDAASLSNPSLRKTLFPSEWQTPSSSSLSTLTTFLGGLSVAGGKLKQTGTTLWNSPNTGATNSSGFTGLPGGFRLYEGSFLSISTTSYYWSSTETSTGQFRYLNLGNTASTAATGSTDPRVGFSVRLTRPITRVIIGAKQTSTTTLNASQMFTLYNLDTTKYRDGTLIPQASSSAQFVAYGTAGTGSWCYANYDPANNATYGKLYNWYAVNDTRGIGPTNYTVPSHSEWTTLTTYLGATAGTQMKEAGTAHWPVGNTGTNTSGFTALPGGYIDPVDGMTNFFTSASYFWTSTDGGGGTAYYRGIGETGTVTATNTSKTIGMSVRLIKLKTVWQTN